MDDDRDPVGGVVFGQSLEDGPHQGTVPAVQLQERLQHQPRVPAAPLQPPPWSRHRHRDRGTDVGMATQQDQQECERPEHGGCWGETAAAAPIYKISPDHRGGGGGGTWGGASVFLGWWWGWRYPGWGYLGWG